MRRLPVNLDKFLSIDLRQMSRVESAARGLSWIPEYRISLCQPDLDSSWPVRAWTHTSNRGTANLQVLAEEKQKRKSMCSLNCCSSIAWLFYITNFVFNFIYLYIHTIYTNLYIHTVFCFLSVPKEE